MQIDLYDNEIIVLSSGSTPVLEARCKINDYSFCVQQILDKRFPEAKYEFMLVNMIRFVDYGFEIKGTILIPVDKRVLMPLFEKLVYFYKKLSDNPKDTIKEMVMFFKHIYDFMELCLKGESK